MALVSESLPSSNDPSPGLSSSDARRVAEIGKTDAVHISRACTIRQSTHQLFRFWEETSNLSKIIKPKTVIELLSKDESKWSVARENNEAFQWIARITSSESNQRIEWGLLEGSDIACTGSVRFDQAPEGEGTEVSIALSYAISGGKLATWLAKLTGQKQGMLVGDTLRRFKALMETGEIPTIEGQPRGK